MSSSILVAQHISKSFQQPVPVPVLKDIDLSIKKGDFVSIVGKSGCGKSTLLYILSTMDTDYEGDLEIDGELMRGKKQSYLAFIRNKKIGFVFQFHYLLNEFTVLHNVMLPGLKLAEYPDKEVENRALTRLSQLGIEQLAQKKAYQLSGGEKQRVSIARALINEPLIIMCDEPTGNLDKKNTQIVLDIFKELSNKYGQTLLVVTHDPEFAQRSNRIIEMEDGRIINTNKKNMEGLK